MEKKEKKFDWKVLLSFIKHNLEVGSIFNFDTHIDIEILSKHISFQTSFFTEME